MFYPSSIIACGFFTENQGMDAFHYDNVTQKCDAFPAFQWEDPADMSSMDVIHFRDELVNPLGRVSQVIR